MTLSIIQVGPIFSITAQINLFGRPKTGFVFFIYFPDFRVFNRQDDKALFVLSQQYFIFIRHTYWFISLFLRSEESDADYYKRFVVIITSSPLFTRKFVTIDIYWQVFWLILLLNAFPFSQLSLITKQWQQV